jgi:hypothetical protein
LAVPQRLDERFGSHDTTGVERQERNERLPLGASNIHGLPGHDRLERAEEPDFQRAAHNRDLRAVARYRTPDC